MLFNREAIAPNTLYFAKIYDDGETFELSTLLKCLIPYRTFSWKELFSKRHPNEDLSNAELLSFKLSNWFVYALIKNNNDVFLIDFRYMDEIITESGKVSKKYGEDVNEITFNIAKIDLINKAIDDINNYDFSIGMIVEKNTVTNVIIICHDKRGKFSPAIVRIYPKDNNSLNTGDDDVISLFKHKLTHGKKLT